MNFDDICQFFNWFDHAKTENQIKMIDIWNMNESRFQVNVDWDQWVIISVIKRVTHQFTHLIDSIESTEHITVIETISAEAETIEFFIIIKNAVIQFQWFADIELQDITIDVSETVREWTDFVKASKKKKIILLRARLWCLHRIQDIVWEKKNRMKDFSQKLYIFSLKLKLYLG